MTDTHSRNVAHNFQPFLLDLRPHLDVHMQFKAGFYFLFFQHNTSLMVLCGAHFCCIKIVTILPVQYVYQAIYLHS